MRWKFEREDLEIYKCCFCFHVRTGTLLLGILNLIGHLAGLVFFVVALSHPELIDKWLPEPVPVPAVSGSQGLAGPGSQEPVAVVVPVLNESVVRQTDASGSLPEMAPLEKTDAENLHAWIRARNWNAESVVAASLLTIASMFIAALLIYGTLRGIAKYITPFFCVQMFDLCLSGLTMLSYFSDVTVVRRWITAQDNLPFKEQLLQLDNDHLTLLSLIVFVSTLSVKAYFIGVVWSCYKYLRQRELTGCARMRIYESEEIRNPEDAEMLLPPKYEDVLLMPHQESDAPPPPAYSPQ